MSRRGWTYQGKEVLRGYCKHLVSTGVVRRVEAERQVFVARQACRDSKAAESDSLWPPNAVNGVNRHKLRFRGLE